MPKRRRRKPQVATGGNTDNRRRRDRDSYSTHTHILQSKIPTREKSEARIFSKSGGQVQGLQTNCLRSSKQSALIRPLPPKIFLFFSYTLRDGGACPGLESRGGVRASNMQCKPKYPKTCLLIVLKDCIFTGAERRPTTWRSTHWVLHTVKSKEMARDLWKTGFVTPWGIEAIFIFIFLKLSLIHI